MLRAGPCREQGEFMEDLWSFPLHSWTPLPRTWLWDWASGQRRAPIQENGLKALSNKPVEQAYPSTYTEALLPAGLASAGTLGRDVVCHSVGRKPGQNHLYGIFYGGCEQRRLLSPTLPPS